MAILKELFSVLNEKKVADDEYFVTVGSGKKFDLYTEKAFKSAEAAQKFIDREIKNADDTEAAEAECEQLENAEILSGSQLKKKYPKLFESATLAKQLVRGEKSPKGLMAKLDHWLGKMMVTKDENRFLPSESAVKALKSYGFTPDQVHKIREAAAEAAQTAIARMQKKHGDAVPDKYLSKMGSSFAVFDLYLNVSEAIHKEFAALMRQLFDAKIDKMKDELEIVKEAAEPTDPHKREDHYRYGWNFGREVKRGEAAKLTDKDKEKYSPSFLRGYEEGRKMNEAAEDDDDCVSQQCHAQAAAKSKKDGVVQHINKDKRTGKLYVSDWFDDDETVATYNKGKLSEALKPNPKGTEAWQHGYEDAKSAKTRDGKPSRARLYMNDKALMKKYEEGSREYEAAMKRLKDQGKIKEAQDSKGREIKAGDRLLWVDGNGEHTGTVSADPKFNGGLKVGGRSVKNIIDDADKVTVLKEARSIPGWFADGAKVKLMPEYADKDPNEVFTLKSVDTETGKGRIADDQGKGWSISYYQVYPKNKTPAIHEGYGGYTGKGYAGQGLDGGKRAFKRAELEFELGHEDRAEKNRTFSYSKPRAELGSFGIEINGRLFKREDEPVKFTSKATAEKAATTIASKDFNKGKTVKVVPLKEEQLDESRGDDMKKHAMAMKREGNIRGYHSQMVKYCDHMIEAEEWNLDRHGRLSMSGKLALKNIAKFKKEKEKHKTEMAALKEDSALQGLGKSLAGKTTDEKPSDGVDVPMGDEAEKSTGPSDTEVIGDADDQQTSAEFKVGDVVKTLVGPHKGEQHDVVKVHADGRIDLKPKGIEGTAVKYRNGGITAKPEQVVLAESIIRGAKSLLRTVVIDLSEARGDGMMPLSYKPAKGHKIEAYGRKGMKNTMWRKYFKDSDAMAKWCEDNDATVEGSRDLDKDELR